MTHRWQNYIGVAVAGCVISAWAATLYAGLSLPLGWWTLPLMLLQTHLFTGIFITAHDAMHGSLCPAHPRLNCFIGSLCTELFMFNTFRVLLPKHHAHHRHVATADDPDFHRGNAQFWHWYADFVREHIGWRQFVLAGIAFNVLHYGSHVPQLSLLAYWVLPSVASTLQLFYFGTYLPHRAEADNIHRATSQPHNHLWAFISCYFFGYHYEHHDSPATPWWLLWQRK